MQQRSGTRMKEREIFIHKGRLLGMKYIVNLFYWLCSLSPLDLHGASSQFQQTFQPYHPGVAASAKRDLESKESSMTHLGEKTQTEP